MRPLLRLALLLALCAAAVPARAAEVYRQDEVKAAFLYRFAGFVEWPSETMRRPVFTIAVLGSEGVADELDKLLPRHTVGKLPVRVLRLSRPEDAAGAQMLYVGSAWRRDLRAVADALRKQPVLLVSDRERGLDDGATVNFLMVDRRLRFEVSAPAAQRAGLKLGSGLLTVAVRVRGGPQP